MKEEERGLAERVGALFRERRWTVAVAESCTGGMLGARLTAVPGSSDYFLGGVIAYDDRVKERVLGVDRSLLTTVGAVSEDVAKSMASGVAQLIGTDVGISVTGIAGPGGAVSGKPVGTVWFALALGDEVAAEECHFDGDRENVREASLRHALSMLVQRLQQDAE